MTGYDTLSAEASHWKTSFAPASQVTYATEGFVEKNADRLHRDLVSLLAESTNALAVALFKDAPSRERNTRRHPSVSRQFKSQVGR